MKIESDTSTILSQDKSVQVTHVESGHRRSVSFPLTLYKQDNIKNEETFASINDYWAQLPPAAQDEIFRVYEQIRELFDAVKGMDDLKNELTEQVAILMDYHDPKKVEHWLVHHSGIKVPSSVQDQYTFDVDKNTTRDQTYIRPDYLGLMTLSVIFRAMIPIWSTHNKTVRTDKGKTSKDVHNFRLLCDSVIYKSEPLERLKRYIAANINKNAHTGNHALELLCSDDMGEYNLALVCVRKLCLGELKVEDPRQNLAALVYNYIVDRPPPQGGDFSKRVLEKKIMTESGGETGENNGSNLELYKARSSITVGRLAEMEFPWRNPHQIAIQLCSDYNPEHLDRALQTTQDFYQHQIKPCVVQLSQWVLAPVFPAMGHFYMEPQIILKAFAVTETVLRARGFKMLALLASAYPLDDEEDSIRVTPMGSKSHISNEATERLAHHFPFYREQRKRSASSTKTCLVTEDIKALANKFLEHTWRASADISLVQEVLRTNVRRIPIPPGLRNDLALMLCDAEDYFS